MTDIRYRLTTFNDDMVDARAATMVSRLLVALANDGITLADCVGVSVGHTPECGIHQHPRADFACDCPGVLLFQSGDAGDRVAVFLDGTVSRISKGALS